MVLTPAPTFGTCFSDAPGIHRIHTSRGSIHRADPYVLPTSPTSLSPSPSPSMSTRVLHDALVEDSVRRYAARHRRNRARGRLMHAARGPESALRLCVHSSVPCGSFSFALPVSFSRRRLIRSDYLSSEVRKLAARFDCDETAGQWGVRTSFAGSHPPADTRPMIDTTR